MMISFYLKKKSILIRLLNSYLIHFYMIESLMYVFYIIGLENM